VVRPFFLSPLSLFCIFFFFFFPPPLVTGGRSLPLTLVLVPLFLPPRSPTRKTSQGRTTYCLLWRSPDRSRIFISFNPLPRWFFWFFFSIGSLRAPFLRVSRAELRLLIFSLLLFFLFVFFFPPSSNSRFLSILLYQSSCGPSIKIVVQRYLWPPTNKTKCPRPVFPVQSDGQGRPPTQPPGVPDGRHSALRRPPTRRRFPNPGRLAGTPNFELGIFFFGPSFFLTSPFSPTWVCAFLFDRLRFLAVFLRLFFSGLSPVYFCDSPTPPLIETCLSPTLFRPPTEVVAPTQ